MKTAERVVTVLLDAVVQVDRHRIHQISMYLERAIRQYAALRGRNAKIDPKMLASLFNAHAKHLRAEFVPVTTDRTALYDADEDMVRLYPSILNELPQEWGSIIAHEFTHRGQTVQALKAGRKEERDTETQFFRRSQAQTPDTIRKQRYYTRPSEIMAYAQQLVFFLQDIGYNKREILKMLRTARQNVPRASSTIYRYVAAKIPTDQPKAWNRLMKDAYLYADAIPE